MTTKDLSLKIAGNRVGLLLLHGLCGTPLEMRYVAYGAARNGFTVHCPLLAGHGGEESDVASTTWQDWYSSAEKALHEIRQNCDIVIVGGLSTGALLGLLLAARNPKLVQGTMSYAPTIWLNGWVIPWYARLFNLVHMKWFANLINFPDIEPHGIKDPRVRDFVRKAFLNHESAVAGLPSTPGGAVLEHRWLAQAVRREIGKTNQPALLIHPREDDLAHVSNTEFLQKKLSGRVSTVILDDSYHNITIDRQRQVVVDRTVAFANQVAEEVEAARAAAAKTQRRALGDPEPAPLKVARS
jgi:carboxylesterase